MKNTSLIQFFKYALVGGGATIIDFGILWLLENSSPLDYKIHLLVSFSIAFCFNFLLQKYFTFGSKGKAKIGREFVLFAAIQAIGMGINLGGTIFLKEFILIHLLPEYLLAQSLWIAKIMATGASFIWNFLANKLITFKSS